MEPLLTIRECADWLRVTTRAVHKWVRLDDDPLPVLYAGSKPLFDRQAVLEWLGRRRPAPKERD